MMKVKKALFLILLLLLDLCQSANVGKREATDDEEPDAGDGVIVLDWENGRYTQDELEMIEERQEKTDMHKDGAEVEIMKKQKICDDFFREIKETKIPPEVTDENMHCVENNLPKSGKRKKRSYLKKNGGKWENCIVPYTFDDNIAEDRLEAVHTNAFIAMEYYETWTGFRFHYYTGNNADLNITNPGYLKYVDGGGCWSYVGNDPWFGSNGQPISTCGGTTAIHELAHALGSEHEQENPYSFNHLILHYDNIQPDYLQWYLRNSAKGVDQTTDPSYDFGSLMHYSLNTFNVNHQMTMSTFDKDLLEILESTSNSYYLFRDLQIYHDCFSQFDPCPEDLVCHNGGYQSIIRGVCKCRCPPGFESKTNCSTEGYHDDSWPGDTFSLMKPKDTDCPDGFYEGRMVHWSYSNVPVQSDSHLSPQQSGNDQLVAHDVCTKTDYTRGDHNWPRGKYCFFRKGGYCPPGFHEGVTQTYGAAEPAGSTEFNWGELPDGEHDRLFEYVTCCRDDAWAIHWKHLPLAQPFILLAQQSRCQYIVGTKITQAEWAQYFEFDDDPSYTNLTMSDWRPLTTIQGTQVKMHYCYYEPFNTDCGGIVQLTSGGTYNFSSPNYPSPASDGYRCMWHFESPAGTTMQLDFSDFNIPYGSYPECDLNHDIEVKILKPGSPGIKFCADEFKKTLWTYENYLTVIYRTPGNVGRGFDAKVSVRSDTDQCYNGDGSDGSYQGPVYYAKNFDKCVPWWNVTHCEFHQFDSRLVDADLTGDYCRNVGVGPAPWCYTNADTCETQTCDACMLGSCFDRIGQSTCAGHVSSDPTFCNNDDNKANCMDTCGMCTWHAKISRPTCGPPSDVQGISAVPMKGTYDVGETVNYTCPTQTSLIRTRICTSEGIWSNLNFVCGACPSGFGVFNQRCFRWLGFETYVTYDEATSMCAAYGADVARVDTQAVQDYVYKILGYTTEERGLDAWLGLQRDGSGTWRWTDGTPASYTNWNQGPYNNPCAIMGAWDGKWHDISCSFTANVVCEFQVQVPSGDPVDQIDDCADVVANSPNMCTEWTDFSWANCRAYCANNK